MAIMMLRCCWTVVLLIGLLSTVLIQTTCGREHVAPRHCQGSVKHLHLSVGHDPSTQMIVSFATKWSFPDREAPLGGVHIGLAPSSLDRFVGEQEFPINYSSVCEFGHHSYYYSPYQHHILINGLEPDTTYYYVAVEGSRKKGLDYLAEQPLRDHPSQHVGENITAENIVQESLQTMEEAEESSDRRMDEEYEHEYEHEYDQYEYEHDLLRHRRLPQIVDESDRPCFVGHKVRRFKTAPLSNDGPMTFAIIGDLGQFEHSKETLEHLKYNTTDVSAVILAGDIAYPGFDHRKWDTFFDFMDDYGIFAEVPLQVATGNHDIDKQENENFIFQAYESRFRMPQVRPAELGLYDGPPGLLNLDAPPYPLPYDWGNAYYSFDYGPAKHVVLSAYSSMEPDSNQYNWFVSVLEAVDRSRTPWLLVTIHTPLYNTFDKHHHDPQIFAARDHMEPLFVKHHVNIIFTGHIHAYLRTKNVANQTLVNDGPIHITVGAGGRQCDAPFMNATPEEWVAKRDATLYGYGVLKILNHTHANWKWNHLGVSEKHDYNEIKKSDVHLPPLEGDELIIENQFFLA